MRCAASSHNPMLHFYHLSKTKNFDAVPTLKSICALLSTGQVSHFHYQSLLKGLNNYTYRASDTPEIWESIQTHYKRFGNQFDDHTYALLLNTLYRKRYHDQEFIKEVISAVRTRVRTMEAVGLGWTAEALAPYKQYVTATDIDLFQNRILEVEDAIRPTTLQKLTTCLYVLRYDFDISPEVYRACARLILNLHREMPLYHLAQSLNFLCQKDLTHDCEVYNIVQRYIAEALGNHLIKPRELLIFMNAFSSVYPAANFYALFDRFEEEIVKNPGDYLRNGVDLCTVVHAFSRLKRGQRVFRLLPEYAATLEQLQSNPKSLGVTIAAILRSNPDPHYRDTVVKPIFLRNARSIPTWHFKKCIVFLLKQTPDDTGFWSQVKSLGELELEERDKVHFSPVQAELKRVLGLDLTQP